MLTGDLGQMSAGGEIEAHERVAGLHQGHEDGLVGLLPELGWTLAKRQPNNWQARLIARFSGCHELAAAVITPAGIAFGVLIGHHRALRFEHGARHDIFRGDEFDPIALTAEFEFDRAGDLRIGVGEACGEE